MSHRKSILESFAFRIAATYPAYSVNMGYGNTYAKLIIVHHDHTIPERDGTSGALKRFDLLDEVYRVPYEIVSGIDLETNRSILIELIEMIKPLMIIASGAEATEMLQEKDILDFKSMSGKEFLIKDLTKPKSYAILNPEEYSFARAPTKLKERGMAEWETVSAAFKKLHRQHETNRWKI